MHQILHNLPGNYSPLTILMFLYIIDLRIISSRQTIPVRFLGHRVLALATDILELVAQTVVFGLLDLAHKFLSLEAD